MRFLHLLKSKIHRATVTDADINYIGSITIDEDLMDGAGLYENELVQVADLNNGNRFETYVMKGERGSGIICLNGAAARLVSLGDLIIIFAYAVVPEDEAASHTPKIVFVNEKNQQVSEDEAH